MPSLYVMYPTTLSIVSLSWCGVSKHNSLMFAPLPNHQHKIPFRPSPLIQLLNIIVLHEPPGDHCLLGTKPEAWKPAYASAQLLGTNLRIYNIMRPFRSYTIRWELAYIGAKLQALIAPGFLAQHCKYHHFPFMWSIGSILYTISSTLVVSMTSMTSMRATWKVLACYLFSLFEV